MFIKIKDLELRKIEFDQNFEPGLIDLGAEIQQKLPCHAWGRAELIRENRGAREVVEDIRLVGGFSTQVEVRCARCLDPVRRDVRESFDLIYRPQGVDARGPESSIGRAETEIGYYQGEGLLLEDVLKEQVLLALPVKLVCSSECKGLCPQCGRNLNVEDCDCVTTMSDPRWAALEDIRKKLEH
ncbi:MAG TPA: DUF177 domain-containing protein [Candidatus Angelobacter sp.]